MVFVKFFSGAATATAANDDHARSQPVTQMHKIFVYIAHMHIQVVARLGNRPKTSVAASVDPLGDLLWLDWWARLAKATTGDWQ